MKKADLTKFICYKDMSIVDAMKIIDKNSVGLVYIVDSQKRLVGCLTDGDIRRWILSTGSLSGSANDAMNHQPKFVYMSDAYNGRKLMSEEHVYSIAVVDEQMILQDIIFLESHMKLRQKYLGNALKGVNVIIMAGGKGTRLYPFTKILPKPLIPIGDIPIIERIMERFSDFGVTDFYLTVNYKKEMIKSYFADANHVYSIHYIEENLPLGTAGSIKLIKEKFDGPTIVTNCDILIEANYEKILKYHEEALNDVTIVTSLKNTIIPYGVIHAKAEGIVEYMEEKPQLSYFINTGMYIINPCFFEWIPDDIIFHMTDLVELMMKKNKKVGIYPISENSFLDMGQFEEMKKMEERINAGYVQ